MLKQSHEVLTVLVADGSSVSIRLLIPTDRAHLVDGFGKLSAASRRSRFFSAMPEFNDALLERLSDLDGFRHIAVGAFQESDGVGNGIGVARSIQTQAIGPAELAVTVIDGSQGNRVGELLLRVLIAVVEERSSITFVASVLRDNRAALKTFKRLGARTQTDPEDPTIIEVELAGCALTKPDGWPPGLSAQITKFAKSVS